MQSRRGFLNGSLFAGARCIVAADVVAKKASTGKPATGKSWDWNMKVQDIPGYEQHWHGGGDFRILRDFLMAVDRHDPSLLTSSLEASVESHLIGFACE